MDGVLIDSEPLYLSQLMDFFKQHQVRAEPEQFYKMIGASSKEVKRMVHDIWIRSRDDVDFDLWYDAYENDEEEIDYRSIIDSDAFKVISELKKRNIKTGIASSSSIKDIEAMMRQCELQVDYYTSGQMFEDSKPDPSIYLHVMNHFMVDGSEMMIIEDSPYGIQAAKAAKALTVVKKQQFPMDQSGGDAYIEHLFDVLKLLD